MATTKRAKALAVRRKTLRLTAFHTTERYMSRKLAALADWAAREHPKQTLTYEECAFALFKLGQLPKPGSMHVESVKRAVGGARKYMQATYSRDLVTVRGVGIRGTINSADALSTTVTRAALNHRASGQRLKAAANMVSSRELRDLIADAPEDLRNDLEVARTWFDEYLTKYLKRLDSINTKALLPPPPKD